MKSGLNVILHARPSLVRGYTAEAIKAYSELGLSTENIRNIHTATSYVSIETNEDVFMYDLQSKRIFNYDTWLSKNKKGELKQAESELDKAIETFNKVPWSSGAGKDIAKGLTALNEYLYRVDYVYIKRHKYRASTDEIEDSYEERLTRYGYEIADISITPQGILFTVRMYDRPLQENDLVRGEDDAFFLYDLDGNIKNVSAEWKYVINESGEKKAYTITTLI